MAAVLSRVSEQEIEGVVNQIVQEFQPDKIVLFGSYAYGQPNSASDVDMLVIMDTNLKESEQAVTICRHLDYHFGLDLIVRTPENVKKRLGLGDSFLYEITASGKTLYARTNS